MYSTLLIKAYHNLVWSLLESMAKIEWLFIPGTAFPLSPVNIKSLPMPSGKCNKFSLRHNRFFPKFRKSKYDSKVDKENSICEIESVNWSWDFFYVGKLQTNSRMSKFKSQNGKKKYFYPAKIFNFGTLTFCKLEFLDKNLTFWTVWLYLSKYLQIHMIDYLQMKRL